MYVVTTRPLSYLDSLLVMATRMKQDVEKAGAIYSYVKPLPDITNINMEPKEKALTCETMRILIGFCLTDVGI